MIKRNFINKNTNTIRHRLHDVIKWKHFPRYRPFVRGVHGSPQSFDVVFLFTPEPTTVEQTMETPWFETPSRSLWRHCNGESTGSYSKVVCRKDPISDVACLWCNREKTTFYQGCGKNYGQFYRPSKDQLRYTDVHSVSVSPNVGMVIHRQLCFHGQYMRFRPRSLNNLEKNRNTRASFH